MVFLELIIIGGAVYYFKKHHKEKYVVRIPSGNNHLHSHSKARKAALLSGQPFQNRNGTVIYPPAYPGLPDVPPVYAQAGNFNMNNQVREQPREYYSDVPANVRASADEKAPLMAQSRGIEVTEVNNEKS